MKVLGNPDGPAVGVDVLDAAIGRLSEAVAMLDAIEHGDLFADLPASVGAATRHQCGVSLLSVLRRELESLSHELQSASYVQDLMNRISRPSTI